jgi:uncharacterized protein
MKPLRRSRLKLPDPFVQDGTDAHRNTASESGSYCLQTLADDPKLLVWCLSGVEVVSAMCRRVREGALSVQEFRSARDRLEEVLKRAHQVTAIEKVRQRAMRLLEVHPLRAADACQLASVLVVSQEDPQRISMLTFDERLREAALKEGFIVNPGSGEPG